MMADKEKEMVDAEKNGDDGGDINEGGEHHDAGVSYLILRVIVMVVAVGVMMEIVVMVIIQMLMMLVMVIVAMTIMRMKVLVTCWF